LPAPATTLGRTAELIDAKAIGCAAIQNDEANVVEAAIKILKDDLDNPHDPVVSGHFCLFVAHLIMKPLTGMSRARLMVLKKRVISLLNSDDVLDNIAQQFGSAEHASAFKIWIKGDGPLQLSSTPTQLNFNGLVGVNAR
jgi:hypothetical protein